MSEIKKKKKKLSTSALVLIIACIIILIPLVIFAAIIITASIQNSKPVFGSRFTNDLSPAITDSQISAVETNVSSISGVEKCEVVLTTAQFRVNIDTNNTATEEDIQEIVTKAYDVVGNELPINTYFKMSSDGQRMYDLEINGYNYIPDTNDDPNWNSVVLTKNSKMSQYKMQTVSKAVDEELAKQLRGEAEVSEEPEEEPGESD